WRVICCSNYMVSHVKWVFGLPQDKLIMIPNGVDAKEYDKSADISLDQFRLRFALPEEKIVLFVGRLVYEKGIHVLINAVPKVLEKVNAKFVIVGNGYLHQSLSEHIRNIGLAHKVMFTGFVDDNTLRNLQKCADVSVVPSLFEPFGIVALEAMAAKSPVVVSDTGGLSEIVEHEVTGVKVYPNNPDSLAWGITRVLLDENLANNLREKAFRKVTENYNWEKISQQTKKVYESVLSEYSKTFWA
ncbi:MAG: glycosyltransferase family 4 protein, partial [Candidatus Bathyarchaeia archaeon]